METKKSMRKVQKSKIIWRWLWFPGYRANNSQQMTVNVKGWVKWSFIDHLTK